MAIAAAESDMDVNKRNNARVQNDAQGASTHLRSLGEWKQAQRRGPSGWRCRDGATRNAALEKGKVAPSPLWTPASGQRSELAPKKQMPCEQDAARHSVRSAPLRAVFHAMVFAARFRND
jgi:hypothetical protein